MSVSLPASATVQAIVDGGTGATTTPAALANLGAAANGSNVDITSLNPPSGVLSLFNTVSGTVYVGSTLMPANLLITNLTDSTSTLQGFRSDYTSTADYTDDFSFNAISGIYGGQSTAPAGHGTIGLSVAMAPAAPIAPATWSAYSGTELYAATFGLVVPSTTPLNTNADLMAFSAGATINATTKANGAFGSRIYGGNLTTNVGAAGVVNVAQAMHIEQAITSGGQVQYRSGVHVLANGQASATSVDAAFSVACANVSTQCYNYLVALEQLIPSPSGTLNQPLNLTATLIGYDNTTACTDGTTISCPFQIANWINLPNVRVTGDLFRSPYFGVTGMGAINGTSLTINDTNSIVTPANSISISSYSTTAVSTYCNTTGAHVCLKVKVNGTDRYAALF